MQFSDPDLKILILSHVTVIFMISLNETLSNCWGEDQQQQRKQNILVKCSILVKIYCTLYREQEAADETRGSKQKTSVITKKILREIHSIKGQ